MEKGTTLATSFFQNELKGFVYKRVKDKALTEDIVQDVFLKVHARIGQLQESEKINAWIYKITANSIIDHYRKQAKQIHAGDLNWENDSINFNECVERALQKLLLTLPEKYREALQLAELDNLPQHEIAKRLNISYSGIKSRVQRARQMLKDKARETLIIETDSYGNVLACGDRKTRCCL